MRERVGYSVEMLFHQASISKELLRGTVGFAKYISSSSSEAMLVEDVVLLKYSSQSEYLSLPGSANGIFSPP
jgi:hypothetical protein